MPMVVDGRSMVGRSDIHRRLLHPSLLSRLLILYHSINHDLPEGSRLGASEGNKLGASLGTTLGASLGIELKLGVILGASDNSGVRFRRPSTVAKVQKSRVKSLKTNMFLMVEAKGNRWFFEYDFVKMIVGLFEISEVLPAGSHR
jgi:hypothetical protein